MDKTYVLGVDISKNHLDLCLLSGEQMIQQGRCANTTQALTSFLKALLVEDARQLLICAEHTGMYGYHVIVTARKLNLSLWMENPAQIKLSNGLQRGKDDVSDAHRIARYATRFRDRARLIEPAHEVIQQLEYLQSERALLVADRAKYKGQLSDQKAYMPAEVYRQKAIRLKALISEFTHQITAIEQSMQQLLASDLTINKQYCLLQSIPGVGPRLALAVIIATKGFTGFDNPRAFCCHAGVAPFKYHSGQNTFTKARVSHKASKPIKTLLHMGALSAIRGKGELRDYYIRKCEEGKAKMSVINAIRSKLIHRMFAVIKRDEEYVPILA